MALEEARAVGVFVEDQLRISFQTSSSRWYSPQHTLEPGSDQRLPVPGQTEFRGSGGTDGLTHSSPIDVGAYRIGVRVPESL